MNDTDLIEARSPSVTVCPPGKRSREIVARARAGTVPVTTATGLQWPQRPSSVPTSKDDRRPAQERLEAAQRADALSVALAQPHRAVEPDPKRRDDPRLAFALWPFCLRVWPDATPFREAMYQAGVSYETEVRALRVARGEHVDGCLSDSEGEGDMPDEETPEQVAARRAAIFALERTLARSDAVLRDVMPRCPPAMVRLCFEHREPGPYDGDMLRAGLYRLAIHYGHWREARYA